VAEPLETGRLVAGSRGAGRPVSFAAPTEQDPLVRAISEGVSGPVGTHSRPGAGWWNPIRVLLAVTTITFTLGMIQKSPCVLDDWQGPKPFTHLCYSDIGYLYADRGFAENQVPYLDDSGRYPAMEYPVLTGFFAYGAGLVTNWFVDARDVSLVPTDEIPTIPAVQANSSVYFAVTVTALFVCALLAVWAMAGIHARRPWDAMFLAAAPALALAGTINWDLLAVAFVMAALLAWSRSHPLVCGILIGLGTASKLYPLFVLGPLLVLCLRTGKMRAWLACLVGAGGAWLAVNAPVYLQAPDTWAAFWTFNVDRGGDYGSFWYVLFLAGHPVSARTINLVTLGAFGLACLAIAGLGLFASRRPRLPQLAFLVVASFLLVNKVYSPQYVLWLLPLAALARPRWRDVLIWQSFEVLYFVGIWMHLGGMLQPAGDGVPDRTYWLIVFLRLAATAWFMGMVVRDILQPWNDPVRQDGVDDDPAGGVFDEGEDVPWVQRVLAPV
jgi:uncharacterized membrane protein